MNPIKLNLPEELLERIDRARGDVARSVWIRRACEMRLGRPVLQTKLVPMTDEEWTAFQAGAGIETPEETEILDRMHGVTPIEPGARTVTLSVGTVPIPCQCGGVIYQAGVKKGKCSRCSTPRS